VQLLFAGGHPQNRPARHPEDRRLSADRFASRSSCSGDMNLAGTSCGVRPVAQLPRRPLGGGVGPESVFNATLNMSVLDGWWPGVRWRHSWPSRRGLAPPALQDSARADLSASNRSSGLQLARPDGVPALDGPHPPQPVDLGWLRSTAW
jgi:hypothetical protein